MFLTTANLAAPGLLCMQAADARTLPQFAKLRETELQNLVADGPSDKMIHVDLIFKTQPNFEVLKAGFGKITDEELPKALRQKSLEICQPEQAAALKIISAQYAEGNADQIAALWLTNVVGVTTTPEVILELAALPEVNYVHYDPPREGVLLDAGGSRGSTCDQNTINSPWGWKRMNAKGQGIVIAVIDTGTCYTHPDLVNNIWVNPGEDLDGDGVTWDADDMNGIDDDGNGYVDDLIGWAFDHTTGTPNNPMDHGYHGTHTSGTVVGDGTDGSEVGTAPGAKVMPVRTSTLITHEIEVWQGMEYAMLMDADVISMSLGWWYGWLPDRATWRANCDNTQASGVMMVIAAGNEGSWYGIQSVRTPGDVPDVTTVGATDCSDNIASFSSVGPVQWADVPPYNDHPHPPGLNKPDVSAPGVDTLSTYPCSGYTTLSGTSMATPHVAGAAAILRSIRPDLSVAECKAALMATSVDFGPPGLDNQFGAGRIDVAEMLRTYAPLRADIYKLGAATGGTVNFPIEGTAARAGHNYWLLGSASGNEPGTTLPGGIVMPINQDWLFNLIMAQTNGPIFQNNRGTLDGAGFGSATVQVTPGMIPGSLVGQFVSFACATSPGSVADYTTNPVNLEILP
ncbi:MAG: S8 family serine peptidase [Planctomycetes bacterium]|nr:S8 family serine peptidase [Planctomycetota bacterium]